MATMATVTMTSINEKPRARAELGIFCPRRVFGPSAQALRRAANRRSEQGDRWSKAEGVASSRRDRRAFVHGDGSQEFTTDAGEGQPRKSADDVSVHARHRRRRKT